jgi:hypothetical protein
MAAHVIDRRVLLVLCPIMLKLESEANSPDTDASLCKELMLAPCLQ